MAVTIDATRSHVWPWLVQIGYNRAGWYSWDLLDNRGIPSADRIHPGWQDVSIGDHLPATSSGQTWFEIAALEPERFLALRSARDLRRGCSFDTNGKWPRFYSCSTWCFLLDELPGRRTRLVVSGYARSNPGALTAILDVMFWEPVHWLMQTRQFANLRRRAERDLQPATDSLVTGAAVRRRSADRKKARCQLRPYPDRQRAPLDALDGQLRSIGACWSWPPPPSCPPTMSSAVSVAL